MTAFESHYSPGRWVAVSAETGWLLVDLRLTDERLANAWSRLRAGASADEVLDVLLSDGLQSLPGFALVTLEQEALRIIVRGAAAVDANGRLVETANATWLDETVPRPMAAVRLYAKDVDPGRITLPMSAGISQASQVVLHEADSHDTDAEPAAREPEPEPPPTEPETEPLPTEPETEPEPPPTEPEPEPEPPPTEPEPEPPPTEPETEPEPPPAEPEPAEVDDAPRGIDYSDFFAGTESRSAFLDRLESGDREEGAAAADVPASGSVDDSPAFTEPHHTAVWPGAPEDEPLEVADLPTESAPPPIPTPPPVASPSGLIDRLPWEDDQGTGPPAPAPPSAAPLAPPPAPVPNWTPAPTADPRGACCDPGARG